MIEMVNTLVLCVDPRSGLRPRGGRIQPAAWLEGLDILSRPGYPASQECWPFTVQCPEVDGLGITILIYREVVLDNLPPCGGHPLDSLQRVPILLFHHPELREVSRSTRITYSPPPSPTRAKNLQRLLTRLDQPLYLLLHHSDLPLQARHLGVLLDRPLLLLPELTLFFHVRASNILRVLVCGLVAIRADGRRLDCRSMIFQANTGQGVHGLVSLD